MVCFSATLHRAFKLLKAVFPDVVRQLPGSPACITDRAEMVLFTPTSTISSSGIKTVWGSSEAPSSLSALPPGATGSLLAWPPEHSSRTTATFREPGKLRLRGKLSHGHVAHLRVSRNRFWKLSPCTAHPLPPLTWGGGAGPRPWRWGH